MVYVGSSWVELDYWTSPTGYGDYDARLRVLAYSTQDVVANTSRVYFKLQKRVTGGSAYNYNDLDFSITGTGGKNDGHSATQTWTFGSVSSTSWTDVGGDDSDMYWSGVKHNDNGSLTLTAHASGDRVLSGTFSTNISIELPTIPRASVPTASPNPITIDDLGNTLTVYTNRKSSTFKHTIKVQCGTWSWTSSARSVETSVNVTIPYSVIAQFSATSTTASATVTCTTFNGTTQIGSAQTCSVKFQINPNRDHANVGTISVEDTNSRTSAVTQDDSIYIANISTLQATIPLSVSGDYTQLASAVVTCGNKSQSYTLSGTSATLTFIFDKVNASSLSVKVTDKRGNSVTGTKSWTLIQYQPITLTATVGRPSATGSAGVGQITGMAYGGEFGATQNSVTVTMDFKLHDASDYDPSDTETDSFALTQSGYNQYTKSYSFAYQFDYQYQYDVRFTISDLFSTAVYTAQMMQGLPIMSWDETEVDVFGNLHIHDRDNPTVWQDVMDGFDAVLAHGGQKNLFSTTGTTTTSNGVTYTVNSDGTVDATGTCNSGTGFSSYITLGSFFAENGVKYIVTGCPSGGSATKYRLTVGGYGYEYGDGYSFTGDGAEHTVSFAVYRNQATDFTIKPMIRDARIASQKYVERMPMLPLVLDAWASSTAYTATSSTGTVMHSKTIPYLDAGKYLFIGGGAFYVSNYTGTMRIVITAGGNAKINRTLCGTNSTNNTNSASGLIVWKNNETLTNVTIQCVLATQQSGMTTAAPSYRQRWFCMMRLDDSSMVNDVYV